MEGPIADGGDSMDTAGSAPATDVGFLDLQLREAAQALAAQDAKHKMWQVDNQRRKHNYVPFVVHLLRLLADKGELLPLLQRAKTTA
jgi:ubiquitin carboxyl-terminal hydrolase L5